MESIKYVLMIELYYCFGIFQLQGFEQANIAIKLLPFAANTA